MPVHERVQAAQVELKARVKALSAAATALGPLAKPQLYADLNKVDAATAKVRQKIEALVPRPKAALAVVESVETWRRERQAALRDRLGRELKAACERAGLSMRVVTREQPVEVRIPPVAVVIDLERASAEILFARQPLARCAADPDAIVAAVAKAKDALDTSFEPAEFFDRCLTAWKAARVATGSSERVEILDFLPYLALAMQGQRFKVEPTKANFADYTRARFAYDVLRLRRSGHGFSRNGYRLNLGVATGSTASQKKRVVYLEDEDGNGEYKLTVFFSKEEGAV